MLINKTFIKKIIGKIFKVPYLKFRNKNILTIFVFHEINDKPSLYAKENNLNLTIKEFKEIINLLKKYYNFISPKDINKIRKVENPALITFDDGFLGVFKNALPYLEKKKIPSINFLNMGPIISKKPNISATIQYLEKYNKNFQNFLDKKNIINSSYLSISPKLLNEFQKKFSKISSKTKNEIKKYQGNLVNQGQLQNWDQSKYVFYANHLYDHWNTIILDKLTLKYLFYKNIHHLKKYKNFINFFAFTNGQPDTCFNFNNLNELKKFNCDLIFSASSGQNKIRDKFFLDRFGISRSELNENIFFYRIFRSFLNFKIRKYQNEKK
jgi:hypothetical protein